MLDSHATDSSRPSSFTATEMPPSLTPKRHYVKTISEISERARTAAECCSKRAKEIGCDGLDMIAEVARCIIDSLHSVLRKNIMSDYTGLLAYQNMISNWRRVELIIIHASGIDKDEDLKISDVTERLNSNSLTDAMMEEIRDIHYIVGTMNIYTTYGVS